jgi:RNA polymerase sigma factor FliA
VHGAMVDLIRRAVPLSRGGMERARRIAAEERRLTGELGRLPSEAELAAALGIAPGELAMLRGEARQPQLESIDEAYSDHDPAFADPMPDSLDLLAGAELREAVAAAIAALPERLALVMQLYFVEELNLAEIAATLDVSVPRVHQLKAQALDRLRVQLADFADIA